jgi:DNA-binding IclR family transcriptional regulator
MSCQKVLDTITEEGITSAKISEITGLPRKYVAACLVRFMKRGTITSKKVEASNKLGPRVVSVFSLAKQEET